MSPFGDVKLGGSREGGRQWRWAGAMKIRTPRDVAIVVREARLTQHLSQADLAEQVNVSRAWVIKLEQGRERLELGLVLKAMDAVGLVMNVSFERLMRRATSGGRDIENPLDW
jgi:transcriptional regulator with XRE-family HTH domain